jgi:hypothetical protein
MKTHKIIKKTVLKESIKVYDFTVKDDHHYILENGVLSHNSYVPTKDLGGGNGIKYAASNIIMLSKSKDKTDEGIVGNFIKCTNYKNRFVKENMHVQTRLNYTSGLSRYYGLTDLAIEYNIFKKVSTRVELPDGTKAFEKNIDEDPEKYFTKDILDKLDVEIQKGFKYGQGS